MIENVIGQMLYLVEQNIVSRNSRSQCLLLSTDNSVTISFKSMNQIESNQIKNQIKNQFKSNQNQDAKISNSKAN